MVNYRTKHCKLCKLTDFNGISRGGSVIQTRSQLSVEFGKGLKRLLSGHLLRFLFFTCQGTDEPVVDDMQRLEQQAQAVSAGKDVSAKLKEKVLFVR